MNANVLQVGEVYGLKRKIMKYEIHKWSNGVYSPVWVECDGVKIADFGHNDQGKSLQYAELFVEALNSKLRQPAVSDALPNPEHCDSKLLCDDRFCLKGERCNYDTRQ